MCYNSDVQIFVVFFNTCAKSLIYDSCKWTCACVAMELLNLQPKNYIPLAEQGNSFDSQCKQQQRAGSKQSGIPTMLHPTIGKGRIQSCTECMVDSQQLQTVVFLLVNSHWSRI